MVVRFQENWDPKYPFMDRTLGLEIRLMLEDWFLKRGVYYYAGTLTLPHSNILWTWIPL